MTSIFSIFVLTVNKSVCINVLQSIDIGALCVHPACVVSITLTLLRTESGRHSSKDVESIVLNISGRLLMVQRELRQCTDNDSNLVSVYKEFTKVYC